MVKKIKTLTVVSTASEFEAILLEAKLIRGLQPVFNSRLKDDKSPLYILITAEKFPVIKTIRGRDLPRQDPRQVFGPFISSSQTDLILKTIRGIFPFCADPNSKKNRPCFFYQLGQCPGVCVGKVSLKAYSKQIGKIVSLLSGDTAELVQILKKEMQRDAKNQLFEAAGRKRDQILRLQNLSGKNFGLEEDRFFLSQNNLVRTESVGFRIEGFDVSHLKGGFAAGSMVVFVNGRPDKSEYRHFRLQGPLTVDDPKMIYQVVQRRLLHPEWPAPNLILIDGGEPQLRRFHRQFKFPVIGLVKGKETIVLATATGFKHLNLPKSNPGLKLLMAIRDESHRFARRLHHKLHRQSIVG